jgi:hypothetical protein
MDISSLNRERVPERHCHDLARMATIASAGTRSRSCGHDRGVRDSVLFLIFYVIYHYNVSSVKFPGEGLARTLYLLMLFTHVVLAALVPVLAIVTLTLGLRGSLVRHRRLARWTLPIWLYVSVTGVVIYVVLYHVYGATAVIS